MKRILTVLTILCAVWAYAGQAKMPPAGGMMPPSDQNCGPVERWMKDRVSLSQDEAKQKFKEFIAQNLKGYEMKEINSIYMPFGSMHQASVKDSSGNKFFLNITPDGSVAGPLLISN